MAGKPELRGEEMGYILMAYASGGYQEYMLPDIDNADYTILLDREVFGLRNSLELPLEIMDGVWRFVRKRDIRLRQRDGEDGFGKGLEDGLILNLSGEQEEHIALVTLQCGDSFPAFQKYDLLHINQITVGKDADSHICYDFAGFISWNHALLFRHGSRWVVQDNSSNGTYLNGRRISGQTFLKFGDQITLFGLRLIFLESCLAVCALSGEPHIDEKKAAQVLPPEGTVFAAAGNRRGRKTVFQAGAQDSGKTVHGEDRDRSAAAAVKDEKTAAASDDRSEPDDGCPHASGMPDDDPEQPHPGREQRGIHVYRPGHRRVVRRDRRHLGTDQYPLYKPRRRRG